jgi:hypothetical protein
MKVLLERRWGNKSSCIEKLHLLKQSRPNKYGPKEDVAE